MNLCVKIPFFDLMHALREYPQKHQIDFEKDYPESCQPSYVIGVLVEYDEPKAYEGDYVTVDFGDEFCRIAQVPKRACTFFVDTRIREEK